MPRKQTNFVCSVEGCNKKAHAKGWCRTHWTRMHLYGRLHKIQGLHKGTCKVEGCNNPIKGRGLCNNHYQMNRKYGRTIKLKRSDKTRHPFYHLWFERKQNDLLCDLWMDFYIFAQAVSPKPEGNYFLKRLDVNKPYGPDNFIWDLFIKKEEDEPDSNFWARCWENQRTKNPDKEYNRNLVRDFGITIEQYNEMLAAQNGVCAICGNEETIVFKSGRRKRLAVDHCHTVNKIRELLCHRCNVTLGSVKDNVELLDKMKDYLLQHQK